MWISWDGRMACRRHRWSPSWASRRSPRWSASPAAPATLPLSSMGLWGREWGGIKYDILIRGASRLPDMFRILKPLGPCSSQTYPSSTHSCKLQRFSTPHVSSSLSILQPRLPMPTWMAWVSGERPPISPSAACSGVLLPKLEWPARSGSMGEVFKDFEGCLKFFFSFFTHFAGWSGCCWWQIQPALPRPLTHEMLAVQIRNDCCRTAPHKIFVMIYNFRFRISSMNYHLIESIGLFFGLRVAFVAFVAFFPHSSISPAIHFPWLPRSPCPFRQDHAGQADSALKLLPPGHVKAALKLALTGPTLRAEMSTTSQGLFWSTPQSSP